MDHLEVGGEAGEHLDLQLALGESLHGVHADLDQAADERREDCLLEQPDVAAHERGEEILRLRHGDPGDADLDDDQPGEPNDLPAAGLLDRQPHQREESRQRAHRFEPLLELSLARLAVGRDVVELLGAVLEHLGLAVHVER